MLLILVLSRQKGDDRWKNMSKDLLGDGTCEWDCKEHLQSKGSRWYIFLHRNHTELLFRQCATRLSVAVLDIAFQVM